MTPKPCHICAGDISFGEPSAARWVGIDGKLYCSIHHTQRFGHSQPLVLIEDFEPPAKRKEAAKKAPAKPKAA